MTYKTFRCLYNLRRSQGWWPEQQKSSKSGEFLIFISRTQTLFLMLSFHKLKKKIALSARRNTEIREKDFLTPKPWLTTQGAIRDKRQTANVPRMKFSFRRVFAIALKDWSWEISWRFYVRKIAWIISFSDAAMSFHLLVWSIIASCKAEWL